MSVLIRGMEMPTSCNNCKIRNGVFCPIRNALADRDGKRCDCPLIPVPEHGDLINRQDAYISILNGLMMTGYQSRALDCINDFYVPTIIPADKEGEG